MISVNAIRTDNRHFAPRVTESGLSLSVTSSNWKYGEDSGVSEETVLSFHQSDANKTFDVSYVRDRTSKVLSFYLIVQDPEVVAPMVPDLNTSIEVLFPLVSGKVNSDGTGFMYLYVRNFVSGK